MILCELRWSSAKVIGALTDGMVIKGVPEHFRSDDGPRVPGQGSVQVLGHNGGKQAVYRTWLSMGKRLLRMLQL
jgi:putative transposase